MPVLVDFYADWCGPCKMMAPVLDEIARERAGEVLVAKLDTDRNPTMAVRYDIRGIPNLIVFRDGREVARQVGAAPRAAGGGADRAGAGARLSAREERGSEGAARVRAAPAGVQGVARWSSGRWPSRSPGVGTPASAASVGARSTVRAHCA